MNEVIKNKAKQNICGRFNNPPFAWGRKKTTASNIHLII